MSDYCYQGTELALFAHAVNWKGYWRSQVSRFIRGAVLEVGAGTGNNTRVLEDMDYARWVCLEPDSSQCAELRTGLTLSRRTEVIVGMLADLPAEDRFDTILYLDVLEHIADDKAEMQLACEHLNPAGNLIVLAPAHQWLFSPFDRAVGHQRRYCGRSLSAAVPRQLSPVFLRYLDSAGLAASIGNRFVLRQQMPTERQLRFWDRRLVPVSRRIDRAVRYRFGKSIVGVWRKASE